MGAKIDARLYVGKVYGHLKIVEPVEDKKGNWVSTKCVCGKIREYKLCDILYGATTSCGCKGITDREECIGNKYKKLTIIGLHKEKIWYAICRCECGNDYIAPLSQIKASKYASCGCIQKGISKSSIKGGSKERLYGIWSGIKARCNNPNYHAYKDYGGRGIKMCPEWENDYGIFRRWALDEGFREEAAWNEYTVERINNDGDYSPGNCKLASMNEQALNKRTNRILDYMGESHPVTEWIRILDLNRETVWSRVKSNMTTEEILYKGNLKKRGRKI